MVGKVWNLLTWLGYWMSSTIINHCFTVSSWLFGFSHILLVNILLHVAIFFPVTMNETSVWKYNIKDQKWKLAWLSLRYVEFKIEDLKLNMI